MPERNIPSNLDAEQAVLGSMFLTKYALQKALESLTPEHFYSDANGKIFTVIYDLSEKGTPIDTTTVVDELENRGWLKQIGDVEYLAKVVNSVATAANIDTYINIVEEKAVLRRLIDTSNKICASAYDTNNEVIEVLDEAERQILSVVKTRKGTEFRSIQDVLFKTRSDLEILAKNKGEVTGIPTGFYDLDKLTAGLQPTQLIILAARPGMGKTAMAVNLATNVAINAKKTVALFNMEMGAEQLAQRMISSVGQIDGNRIRNGRLENNDWKRFDEAVSRLAETNLFIDDTPGMLIGEIRAKCRRLASSNYGLDLVIIDYLQLISGGAKYAGNRQQEVSEISRSLKVLAMELNIPVIACAQLSRTVEGRDDKRPLLSDLRESGSIEQDADIVAFLFREDYYDKEKAIDENTSKAELIVAKHRNGPTRDIKLIYHRNTSTFQDFGYEKE